MELCKICNNAFTAYPDGRGGDIGSEICRKCSCDSVQDLDRSKPEVRLKYEAEICPFYYSK